MHAVVLGQGAVWHPANAKPGRCKFLHSPEISWTKGRILVAIWFRVGGNGGKVRVWALRALNTATAGGNSL